MIVFLATFCFFIVAGWVWLQVTKDDNVIERKYRFSPTKSIEDIVVSEQCYDVREGTFFGLGVTKLSLKFYKELDESYKIYLTDKYENKYNQEFIFSKGEKTFVYDGDWYSCYVFIKIESLNESDSELVGKFNF